MKLRKLNFLFFSVATSICLSSCKESTSVVETKKFTISFNSNGGSKLDAISGEAGSRIASPANPTRNGYSFVGWYTDSKLENKFQFSRMPSQDINLYARWSLDNYIINYNLNGGENNDANPSIFNVLQNDIRLYEPEYANHYFAGWFMDASFTEPITFIDTTTAKDYNLFAKWSEVEVVVDYNIFYHLNEGINGANPTKFNKNDENITLKPATKDGSTFVGWYSDEALTIPVNYINTATTSDVDVYAKWSQIPVVPTYTVTYHLNGGSNGNNPVRYTEDMESFDLLNPTKLSCTFKGWYADEEFTTPISTIDCSLKKDIDVYAKWVDGITEVYYEFDLGIGKEYVLYHVSDTHVNAGTSASDLKYEESRLESRFEYANSFGERYEKKNLYKTSVDNFKAVRNYINSEKPDAVCYTGDLMDYYSVANYNFVNTELAKTEVPYLYSLGNHEDPSSNFTGMTGMDNTYFSVLEFDDFEIVCLDNSNLDSNGSSTFLEEQYDLLLAECQKNKPIIIMEHVPILTSENCDSRIEKCGSYFFIDEGSCSEASAKMIDLICSNENIKLILCGHIHGRTLTYIAPGKPQITCGLSLMGYINKIVIR